MAKKADYKTWVTVVAQGKTTPGEVKGREEKTHKNRTLYDMLLEATEGNHEQIKDILRELRKRAPDEFPKSI